VAHGLRGTHQRDSVQGVEVTRPVDATVLCLAEVKAHLSELVGRVHAMAERRRRRA
jgi:hypothetical protein